MKHFSGLFFNLKYSMQKIISFRPCWSYDQQENVISKQARLKIVGKLCTSYFTK
ncbi:MAG: hypothetical protein RLZZ175_3302 [Bacteroidota bacterium]|jgi:hypothetical protein